MANQTKPDVNTIWASAGEADPIPDDKQVTGWVEEIPFYQDMNGLFQLISQFMKHVNQEGVCVWDAKTVYAIGSVVKSPVDFNVYRARVENSNTPPLTVVGGTVNSNWVRWSYTLPEMQQEISNIFAGSVIAMPVATTPAGWLLCDGSAVSRTTYATLFARIGITAGAGNGVNTFNIPDLRGEFIRGADMGRGVDAGRAVASSQLSAVGRHAHFLQTGTALPGSTWTLPDSLFIQREPNPSPVDNEFARTYTDSDQGSFANETRPRNVALAYYIKT